VLVLGWRRLQFSRSADGGINPASMLHLFKFCGAGTIGIIHPHALTACFFGSPLSRIYLQILLIKRGGFEILNLVGFLTI